jgi:FlgD Ig-like domain
MRLRYLVSLGLISAVVVSSSLAMAKTYTAENTLPSIGTDNPTEMFVGNLGPLNNVFKGGPDLTPGLTASAECIRFADNPALNNGYLFIPPDPSCAAGFAHILNSGNNFVEWRLKSAPVDVPQSRISVDALFAGTPGMLAPTVPTNIFDTRCTYDKYADRFVVVSFQRVTSPALDSRILVAVSKTSDPNGGWYRYSINTLLVIGGVARWADYPCVGFDDDAIYITANMFNAAGTGFGGTRLWILDPAVVTAGPDAAYAAPVYDFMTLSGASVDLGTGTTTMPTSMWGTQPGGVGTFLVQTGWSDGTIEYVAVIRVDTPLAPTWNYQLVTVGDVASPSAVPNATQLGSARTIATVSGRCMGAVWRNNSLYAVHTLRPTVGVDGTQATAHWYRFGTGTLAALTVADQGNVGGEDIAVGEHTFVPNVHVDKCDNMAIGFTASGPGTYAGAYYATRALGDPAGTIGNSQLLAAGLDFYVRTFTSSLTAASRWGDFSGMSLCPVDESNFWVYNEYAGTRGTPTTVSGITEDGQWFTKVGTFSTCQPVAVAISSFNASAKNDLVTLHSDFRSTLAVDVINVYRASGNGSFMRIGAVSPTGTTFNYTDKVAAGNYRYQIGVVDRDGEYMSAIQAVSVKPFAAALAQNEPNPFNPETTIRYTMPAAGNVSINIYDAAGRLVRSLVNGVVEAGSHNVSWNGVDNHNSPVSSGVYFYRLTAGKFSETKKMTLLK